MTNNRNEIQYIGNRNNSARVISFANVSVANALIFFSFFLFLLFVTARLIQSLCANVRQFVSKSMKVDEVNQTVRKVHSMRWTLKHRMNLSYNWYWYINWFISSTFIEHSSTLNTICQIHLILKYFVSKSACQHIEKKSNTLVVWPSDSTKTLHARNILKYFVCVCTSCVLYTCRGNDC